LLDRARGGEAHAAALAAQRAKVADAELTPSAQVLKVMRERGESFEAFSLRQSREHAEYFRQHPLAAEEQARFEKMASDSLAEQTELERDQDGDFDTFVAAYQASILGLISN
ncbi:glutamate--cysteine ligase, partial [Pseudomonas aeruginosa]|nr:glutamate--cysteine ligase [Pseudomonas aeruginosa]